ncbi:MAG: hypothetical protein WC750_04650 [Patescibacteria group bacterium]|jgi:hypothetical protein
MNFLFKNKLFSISSKILMGCFIVLAYGLIQGHSVLAADCTFASTEATNSWHVAANWSCGEVPTSTTPVVIPAATTTNMLGDVAGVAGSVTIVGTLRPWGSTLSVNGDWSMTGAFTAGTSTIDFTGTATQSINHATTFNNVTITKASGTVTALAAVTIGGTLVTSGGGTFSAGASSIEVTGISTIGTGTTVTSTAGTLTFTGAVTGNGTAAIGSSAGNILFSNTLTLNNTSSLSVGSGTATTTGALSGAGNVYSNAGTLVIGASFTGVGFYAGSGTVIFDGGTIVHNFTYNNLVIRTAGAVTVDGNIVVGGTLATSGTAALNLETNALTVTDASTIGAGTTVTSTSGTLTFTGAVTNAGSIGSVTGNKLFGSTLANTGTLVVGEGTATTTGAVSGAGTIKGDTGMLAAVSHLVFGTFDRGPGPLGSVRMYGSTDQNLTGATFRNFEVRKSAGTVTIITNPATVDILETYGAGTLSSAGLDFTVAAFGFATIGAGTTVTSTTGTLTFLSSVTVDGNLGSSAGDMSLISTQVNAGGTFDVGSGTATSTWMRNSGGTVNGNSGMLVLEGDFLNTGTFNADTGTVRIAGSGDFNVTGVAFNNLETLKTGGTATFITSDATVAGTLITAGGVGTLSAGSRALTVTGASTIGAGTTVTSTSGTLTFLSLVTNNGSIGSSTGNMEIGPIILNGGSIFDVGAGTATTSGITLSGTINGGSGTLALTNFLNSAGGTFNANTGTLRIAGASNYNVVGFDFNNVEMQKTAGTATFITTSPTVAGTLVTSGAGTLSTVALDLTVTGISTIGAGTTVTSTLGTLTFTGAVTNAGNIGSSSGDQLFGSTLANSGVLDIGAGVATSTGQLDNSGGTINGDTGRLELVNDFVSPSPGTFNAGTGTVRIYGALTQLIRGLAFNNLEVIKSGASVATITDVAATVAGTLTTSGTGTLDAQALNLTVIGTSTIGTGSTVTSTLGALTFTDAVTNSGSIGSVSGNKLFGSTLANTGTLNVGSGVATTTGALSGVGTINGNSGTLAIVSSWATGGTFNRGTGTVRYAGAADQDLRGGYTYNNLVIRTIGIALADANVTVAGTLGVQSGSTLNAATRSLTVTGATTNVGTTTSTSGTLTFTDAVTNSGSIGSVDGNKMFGLTLANSGTLNIGSGIATTTGNVTGAGTINGNTGTLIILADFTAGTFNSGVGTATVKFNGAADQSIKGLAFNDVIVEKTAGTVTFITTNAFIGGTLGVWDGTLSAGSVNLTVLNNATIVPGGMVTSTTGNLDFISAVGNSGNVGSSEGDIFFEGALLNSGTVDVGSGYTTTTDDISSTGTINGNSGTLTVVAGWAAGGAFNRGTGTVRYAGVADQDLRGGYTYNNLVIRTTGVALADANVTVAGTLGVQSGSTLNAATRTLAVTGVTTNAGTATSTTGTLTFTGAVTNSGNIGSVSGNKLFGDTLVSSGNLIVGSGYTTSTGNLTNTGTVKVNTGKLILLADYSGAGTFTANTGTVYLDGTNPQSIKGEAFNNLVVRKASNTATIATADATVGGTLTTSGGGKLDTQTRSLSITGLSTIGSGTTVTSTSGVLTFTGAVTNAGSIGSVNGNKLFSSTLANTGTLVIGSGVATTTLAFTGAGTIKGNTGTLVVLNNMTGFTTFTAGTGTLRVYGAGSTDQDIKGATFYNIEIKKTGGTATITTANATVGGTLVTIGTGTLSSAALNLTVTGATTIGTTGTVTSTSGTLAFAGVTNAGSLGSNSGSITMTTLGNTGTLSIGGMSTTTGGVTSSGTVRLNGETLNVGGNWTDTGTLTPVAGTVRFNGGGAQSIATEASFYGLTIDKAAGTATLTGHVTTTNLAVDAGTLAVVAKILNAPGTYTNLGLVTRTTGTIKHTGVYNWTNSGGTTQTEYIVPTSSYLRVTDANRNMNGSLAETITVPVTLDGASGSDLETITLTETGPATGIFMSGAIGTYSTTIIHPNNGEVEVNHSGVGTETYTDDQDSADTGATVTTVTFASSGSGGTGGGGGGGGMAPVVTTQQTSSNDPNRIANLANLASMNLPIHSLVKLPDDGKLSTQEDSAVYYVGNDGKRHAFPNSKVYFSWYTNFDGVVVITASQLASIPLGTNVRYKPGYKMVKFTTDPKVYAVDVNSTLRWVKTEALAIALYGENWNTKIDDISDAFFSNYGFGADISVPADFNVTQILGLEKFISDNFNHS